MTKINFLTFIITLFLSICVAISANAGAIDSTQNTSYSNENTLRSDTQNKIQNIFNQLETVGGSYNQGGTSAAGRAALGAGCQAAIERLLQTNLIADIKDGASIDTSALPSQLTAYLDGKSGELGNNALNSLCAALQGQSTDTTTATKSLMTNVKSDMVPQVFGLIQSSARKYNIPFLSNIEIQSGTSNKSLFGSITSVQPLWHDAGDLHHVFAQASWYGAGTETTDLGYNKQYSTLNAGLAYRYLTPDKKALYGANVFFDHSPRMNHNRMSIGVDARTSQLAFFANKYMPLSDWRKIDLYYEEKAAGGYDIEVRGQVPQLPSWTAALKGYEWDAQKNGNDLYGTVASVEYSPVPALAMHVGVRDESQGKPSLEGALRFNWRMDQPQDLQWRERTELAPVSDYVYEKVQRENIIRVKQQRRASSKLIVTQTIGANISAETTGTTSLAVNKTLLMPVTVTVAAGASNIAQLKLSDGSILTIAQGSQVTIAPDLITLVNGSMQYVSNGTITTVAVPGGTVNLHGTDIDVVSNGTDSSVRVREGAVDYVGAVSGSAYLVATQAAKSVTGVIGTLASGSAGYISHTSTISSEIDRLALVEHGEKVAPYPYEAPRIISANRTAGGTLSFGLRFNEAVYVTAGTPRLPFTIAGFSRNANYVSGSGTNDLVFEYTFVAADTGASSLTVNSFNNNGASVMGNGKDAVTTIAPVTLSLTGFSGGDTTAPSGYAAAFTTSPINNANKTAAAFNITSAEIGTTYNYSITSSGGGTAVTGTGTVTAATQSVTGINVTGLNDGTLTVSVTLTDPALNVGTAATATVTKDALAPSGFATVFTTTPVNNANKAAVALNITSAEVGSTYNYSITSSGGGTAVTGTGTVATATQAITAINVTGLGDGTLTVSVTLTDTDLNVSAATTATATKDIVAPTITSVTAPANATYGP